MANRDIVVVGASAGGIPALMDFVSALPESFPAAIFVVLHIPPSSPSKLPEILTRVGRLQAVHPSRTEKVRSGVIYVAPPDRHLLVENGSVLVRTGPKENRCRPSIDALFRSASYAYGSRVIGVVMSGVLDDGTSGLWTIKRRGGLAMVQNPNEAWFADMPSNAIRQVDVDYSVRASEIGKLLQRLVTEPAPNSPDITEDELDKLRIETGIARGEMAIEKGVLKLGDLTPFTCPECQGALVRLFEGRSPRFRCHTGHGFTASSLLAGVTKENEELLWKALRGHNETEMLLNHIGRHFAAYDIDTAARFFRKSHEAAERAKVLQRLLKQEERLSKDIDEKE